MNVRYLFLTSTILLGSIQFTHAATLSDTSKKTDIHSKKSLTISSMFIPKAQDKSLFGINSLSYTFSGTTADTINYVRLCQATEPTCSSCNAPFASITAGTPISFASAGTTYGINPGSIAAYLSSVGSASGSYNIGLYVQATNFNCSSSTAYCSTNSDSIAHALCMQATYNGTSVTALSQSDNGQVLLNVASVPFAYVTNTTGANTVLKCPINSDGAFGACADSGVGAVFNTPRGIAISPKRTFAYVNNNGNSTVSKCPINSDGTFGTCTDSGRTGTAFNSPRGIAINPKGTFAYVANNNSVSKCPINSDGTFGACADSGNSGTTFSGLQGIAINLAGTFAYVVNSPVSTVSKCPINADGTFGSCTDSGRTGAAFNLPRYIVLNNSNTIAYVSNSGSNTVSKCPINGDGTFGACADSGNSGTAFSSPQGIAINFAGTFAYMANNSTNSVLKCPINSDGTFGACAGSGNSGVAFNQPVGIAFTSIS